MNKKIFIAVLAAFLLVAAVSVGYINNPVGQITGSGQYVERPIFKYVKCEAVSGMTYSSPIVLATNGQWLPKPSVASSYNIIVTSPQPLFLDLSLSGALLGGSLRVEYYVCNSQVASLSNCRIHAFFTSGSSNTISGVRNNEFVWMQYQKINVLTGYSWRENSGAAYQIGYIPYGLRTYDVLGGSSMQLNPNDCTIPTTDDSWKDRILASDSQAITQQISKTVNQIVLQPEEVRWYLSGYVSSAAPSFALTYNNLDAWCRVTGSTGEIYKINTVTLASGTYKIASADWNDHLGNVGCCPGATQGNQVCNTNYQWQQVAGSQCGSFTSCGSPNWVPYSSQEIIKYYCDNGYCKSQTQNVECANDNDCKDANKVCDLSSWKCMQANVNLQGQVIRTIPDNKADCEKQGGKWITQTTEQNNVLSALGITKPKVIVKEYCELNSTNWLLILCIAGASIVLIVLFRKQIVAVIHLIRGRLHI